MESSTDLFLKLYVLKLSMVTHTGMYVHHPDIQAVAEVIITLSEKHQKNEMPF